MGQADQPPRVDPSFDDGTGQAMASLAAMLAFVGVGIGLAAYGAYRLSGDDAGGPAITRPAEGEDVGRDAPREDPSADRPTGGSSGDRGGSGPERPRQPVTPLTAEEQDDVDRLIGRLNAEEWSVRTDAGKTLLRKYGERARSALQHALREPPSEEVRYRAGQLLEQLDERRRR